MLRMTSFRGVLWPALWGELSAVAAHDIAPSLRDAVIELSDWPISAAWGSRPPSTMLAFLDAAKPKRIRNEAY